MPEAKRDRYGRYRLPHPETGEEKTWTRATTFAETLEDSYNLTRWNMRAVAVGMGARPDLLALAQSHTMDDKQALDDLCKTALTVASADARSNLGTALHRFTERVDRGEQFRIPAAHQPDIDAYLALKRREGIETHPRYIECITAIPLFGVAGTMDRIVRLTVGQKVCIGDLKTGSSLDYGWKKIAVQLALYSRGCGLWNAEAGKWEAMPPVNQDTGLVIHVPAGTGLALLYEVDLNAGWEAAQLCQQVREWRKRKDLAIEINPA